VERLELTVGDDTFTASAWGPVEGPAVLLLHGFPQSAHSWRLVAPTLAEAGHRVVALDQRGVPATARPTDVEAYRLPVLVDDALGAAGELFGPAVPLHLVGHDWGAAVAWQLAAVAPHLIRSLTAVSVPHPKAFSAALASDPEQREKSQYMLRWREPETPERELLADDAAKLRELLGDGKVPGVDVEECVARAKEADALTAALNWYRAARREDGADTPQPVRVPTTYVWSTGDVAIGRAAAEGVADVIEGPYAFVELDGVSHWVPEEAPDRLAEEILARTGAE
jgi:pimeloyl-ACP methyl ester carboxylesterase